MAARAVDAQCLKRSILYAGVLLLCLLHELPNGVQAVRASSNSASASEGHRSLGQHVVWQLPGANNAEQTNFAPNSPTGVSWLKQQLQRVLPHWHCSMLVSRPAHQATQKPGRSLAQIGGGNMTIPPAPTDPPADPTTPSPPAAPSPTTPSPPTTSPPSGNKSPTPADKPPSSTPSPPPPEQDTPTPTPAPTQPAESSPPPPPSTPTDTSSSPASEPVTASSPSDAISGSATTAAPPLPTFEPSEPAVDATTTRTGSVMVDPVTLVPTGIAMGDNITNSTSDSDDQNTNNQGNDSWRLILSIVVPSLTGIAAVITIAYTGWKWWHKRQATAARKRLAAGTGAFTPTAATTTQRSASRADAGSFYAGGVKPLNADL